ncbi:MAG: hypothetical protein LBD80_02200, partial [Tannerella sp.]|nr:hypothetical protein [Tannerella sp.]
MFHIILFFLCVIIIIKVYNVIVNSPVSVIANLPVSVIANPQGEAIQENAMTWYLYSWIASFLAMTDMYIIYVREFSYVCDA